jgi:hypothetical protein
MTRITRWAAATLAALALLVSVTAPATAATVDWKPKPGAPWQWQLQGTIDLNPNVAAFDVDGFDTSAATVAKIHAKGAGAVCYLSAGSFENWRPDAARFPAAVKGRALDGWAGEKWLDIRRWDVLGPIMKSRMQMCADKGFDAVEPDNVDEYANATGFPLTGAQQITYNRNLAATAHALGLSIALKNDVDQLAALQPYFDFALNEECAQYSECAGYAVFKAAGKAVWNVEYAAATYPAFCARTTPIFGQASMLKSSDLTANPRKVCPAA